MFSTQIIWNWILSAIIWIITLGPMPNHIAFVMDGNRRFAKQQNLESYKGHYSGFNQLYQTLEWCMSLGIKVVTVYAFSIENFKRSDVEVKVLFDLAEEKFAEFLSHESLIKKQGVCVRLIGDLTLLPESTRLAAYKLMRETRHGTKCIFNIACPYTSHEEMETAMKLISHAVEVGKLQSDDISQTLMDMSLYTHEPVDIMVRTSGEVRLSDFMLWQVSLDCYIHFINVLWPEFTFWDMLPILLKYQAHHKNSSSNADISERIGEFVRTIRAFRIDKCRLL